MYREVVRSDEYKKIWEKSNTVFGKVLTEPSDGLERAVENVLGPTLNTFILWVLIECRKKGIQRLYFLARDGYFMYRCARRYCETWGISLECRYLSCSRYSVRIPVFHLDMDAALDYICRGGIDVTVDKILNRAGLNEREKQSVLKEIPQLATEGTIPYARLEHVRRMLEDCDFFMECVDRHSREAFPKLECYLLQEGLLEDKRAAFVDSGWVGSMQKTLNQILKKLGKKTEIPGYYWGLYELPSGVRRKEYFTFFFSPEKGLKEKVYFSNNLFETIFSAPHGMTMGYEICGKDYVPLYGYIDTDRKAFMNLLEKYFDRYTERILEKAHLEDIDLGKSKKAVRAVLKLFMGKPTREEAERFGCLEFSDDVLDDQRQQVAVKMSKEELLANHVGNKALVMLGLRHQYIKESAWYEGSVVRFGQCEGYHLLSYRIYKYLLYMRKKYYYLKMKEKWNDQG